MGVNTLLKNLAPCLEDSHVERFRGKTVAVDGNTFIFRGCYSCSEQVALGVPSSGPVDYLIKRVRMLKHYGVKPWVVLDGRRTPMKDDTSKQRQSDREKNLLMAKDFRRQAENSSCAAEKEALGLKAQSFFQKSIHVTRQMVTNAMSALQKEGVECMVAPYEADAQVAFLARTNLASAVITEDSDILVYMAAVKSTTSVLYKIDEFGKCKELGFDPQKLSSLPGEIGKFCRGLSAFAGQGGGRSFVQLAALAGCDYIDNVRGLGLVTALPIITKFKSIPADKRVSRILLHLKKMGKTIPEGYRERMRLAELSFFWHRVFDPRSKTCVHFCEAAPELIGTADVPDLPSTEGEMAFLGENIESELVRKISCGKVDPVTGESVTAETFPIPGNARGVHRSVTRQPPQSSNPSARPERATEPMATPVGARNQHQQSNTGRSSWCGGRPPPQQPGPKRSSQGVGREAHNLRRKDAGGRGGGGLLKEMFERARYRTEEKENIPPVQEDAAGLRDVSEIVIACRSGQTLARGSGGGGGGDGSGGGSGGAGLNSPAQTTANPFAKKRTAVVPAVAVTTAATPSPSDFRTPCALASSGARSKGNAAHLQGYSGEDSDAWSRLRKGCQMSGGREGGEDSSEADQAGTVVLVDCGNQADLGLDEVCTSRAAISAPSKTSGVKRSLSAPSPRENGGSGGAGRGKKRASLGRDGGRKAYSQRPFGAGKGVTMLSFFGRAATKP